MEERHNHMDDIFSKKLKNYRKEPPEEIWEGIREGLASGRKKRMIVIFMRMAAGIALLAALGLGYYYIGSHGSDLVNHSISENQQKERINDNHPSPESLKKIPPESQGITKSGHVPVKQKIVPRSEHDINGKELKPASVKIAGQYSRRILTDTEDEKINLPDTAAEAQNNVGLNHKTMISGVDPDRLAGGFVVSATKDSIPRDNRKVIASWDMLKHSEDGGTEEKKGEDRLFLSAALSPVYSYRNLGKEKSSVTNFYDKSEAPVISYSGGFNVGLRASERFSIQTGLIYSRLGVEVGSLETPAGTSTGPMDNSDFTNISENTGSLYIGNSIGKLSTGESDQVIISANESRGDILAKYSNTQGNSFTEANITAAPDNVKLDQWFHFIEIPFMMRYKMIDRTIDLNLLGGFSTNFLMGSDVILNSDGEKSYFGSTTDVRKINYSGNVGLGMDVGLGKKIIFSFEPQLKYYLNSFNNHNLISSRPYYIGLYTGIRYDF